MASIDSDKSGNQLLHRHIFEKSAMFQNLLMSGFQHPAKRVLLPNLAQIDYLDSKNYFRTTLGLVP